MSAISFISVSKLAMMLSTDACKNMLVRILDTNQLVLGTDPLKPTQVIDISNERIGPYNQAGSPQTLERPNTPLPVAPQMVHGGGLGSKSTRRSGDYWFEINGARTDCRSLKEVLSGGLRALETAGPGTLERLSRLKPRSKRIVARDRSHLFTKQDLVETYSEQLVNGWWYGTNNSADETKRWLQRACSCAGLDWGVDFKASL